MKSENSVITSFKSFSERTLVEETSAFDQASLISKYKNLSINQVIINIYHYISTKNIRRLSHSTYRLYKVFVIKVSMADILLSDIIIVTVK